MLLRKLGCELWKLIVCRCGSGSHGANAGSFLHLWSDQLICKWWPHVGLGSSRIGPALFPGRRSYEVTIPGFILFCVVVFLHSGCTFALVVLGLFLQYEPRDWLGRTSRKWSSLCRVRCINLDIGLIHSQSQLEMVHFCYIRGVHAEANHVVCVVIGRPVSCWVDT